MELNPPLTSSQLEDAETGEAGEEKVFKVGDPSISTMDWWWYVPGLKVVCLFIDTYLIINTKDKTTKERYCLLEDWGSKLMVKLG